MQKSFKNNLVILRHLFAREFVIIRKDLRSTFLDSLIWPSMVALVYGYLFPAMGIRSLGSFAAVGVVGAVSFFQVYAHSFNLAHDIDGNRYIQYQMSLPISPQLVLVKYAFTFALRALIHALPLLFILKLLLYKQFSMGAFDPIKYLSILLLANLSFGFFFLWIAGWAPSNVYRRILLRVVDPLFFMGGYLFVWSALYKVSPLFSYISLFNPMMALMEGARAAVFGQEGYVNYWFCLMLLAGHICVWFFLTMRSMRKRLDFVS